MVICLRCSGRHISCPNGIMDDSVYFLLNSSKACFINSIRQFCFSVTVLGTLASMPTDSSGVNIYAYWKMRFGWN